MCDLLFVFLLFIFFSLDGITHNALFVPSTYKKTQHTSYANQVEYVFHHDPAFSISKTFSIKRKTFPSETRMDMCK